MKPGSYLIILEQGVGWTRRMTWRSAGVVVPLAAYSARLTVRHPAQIGVYLLTLTEGAEIVLADASPNIIINFSSEQIDNLDITETKYRLDLTPPGETSFPLLKGPLHVERW